MTFKAKLNIYEGRKRRKVRCPIRGNRMRPAIDFDETKAVFHMPSQEVRRLLIAACVAEIHVLQY